jgi:hypothetical protein
MYQFYWQDAMNKYYCTKSAAEKGSIFQMRNKFEHRSVKKNVNDCVNSCVDFDKHCYLANDSYILVILKMTYIPASCWSSPSDDKSNNGLSSASSSSSYANVPSQLYQKKRLIETSAKKKWIWINTAVLMLYILLYIYISVEP